MNEHRESTAKILYRESTTKVKFAAWGYIVHIVLTNNVDASVARRISGHKSGRAEAACLEYHDLAACTLVLPYSAGAPTVAHESWHAIRLMLRFYGAGFDNETVAYHLAHLVEQIDKFQKKSKKFGRTGKA